MGGAIMKGTHTPCYSCECGGRGQCLVRGFLANYITDDFCVCVVWFGYGRARPHVRNLIFDDVFLTYLVRPAVSSSMELQWVNLFQCLAAERRIRRAACISCLTKA